jgi:sodium-independent sulfate anion transporter 11
LAIRPDRSVTFPSVNYLRTLINKSGIRESVPVVVDCLHISAADFTASKGFAVRPEAGDRCYDF